MARPPRIGSQPKPKDPKTEDARIKLTHPYGKKYGQKPQDGK